MELEKFDRITAHVLGYLMPIQERQRGIGMVYVHRPCCVNGFWELEDGSRKVGVEEMAIFHVQEDQERRYGSRPDASQIDILHYGFVPDDKSFHGTEENGVMGMVTIEWDYK